LTPYAVAYRYPADPSLLEPTRDEFGEALALAGEIFAFVLSKLPTDVRPPA
jgi:hypothetical protein